MAHPPPWNLDETRKHVTRLFGRAQQVELAGPALRSVCDRQTYAQIHYKAASAAIESYVSSELQNASLLAVTFCGEGEAWGKFNVFVREIGAHLTACVQSIHAVPDILACALYYSLGLNLRPDTLKARELSTRTVTARLSKEPDAARLATLLESLAAGGDFEHLSALCNQAKHRSIVFPSLSEDWTGERAERHAVTFPAFVHDGATYAQVNAKEFLENEFARCCGLVLQIGGELNVILSRR